MDNPLVLPNRDKLIELRNARGWSRDQLCSIIALAGGNVSSELIKLIETGKKGSREIKETHQKYLEQIGMGLNRHDGEFSKVSIYDLIIQDSASKNNADMAECNSHLASHVSKMQEGVLFRIDWLGLDLTVAKHLFPETILHSIKHKKSRVEMRILAVSNIPKKMGRNLPYNIKLMCEHVAAEIKWLRHEIEKAGEQGLALKVDITQYEELPTIHGLSVASPFQVLYTSQCQNNHLGEYGFVDGKYRIIPGTPSDQESIVASTDFQSLFSRLWNKYWKPRRRG